MLRAEGWVEMNNMADGMNWFARILCCVVVLLGIASSPAWGGASEKKIILDTDPGTDDAMALMLALNSPEFDLRAITVGPGNVTAERGLGEVRRVVSLGY